MPLPFDRPDAYWVIPSRLLAGEYPAHFEDDAETGRMVRALVDHGVTTFLDLTTTDDGLPPYEHHLPSHARRIHHPVPDMDVPTPAHLATILDELDAALESGETVYVHCWGGLGRTGTVVACHLVRTDRVEGTQALATLQDLRRGIRKERLESPQTGAQRMMVAMWHLRDPRLRA